MNALPVTIIPASRPATRPKAQAERRALLRKRANEIAARVAPALGLKKAPRCHRITRNRGRGYRHQFSVPIWAAKHDDYFAYYVAHEVVHAHSKAERNHGPEFRRLEAIALAELGLAPIYQKGGRGPYVEALVDASGGFLRCVRLWPLDPTDPPTVYPEAKL